MCRNRSGKNFGTYHPQFLRAVGQALTDPPPTIDERLARPPTLDGQIDEGEYGAAVPQGSFVALTAAGPAPVKTEFRVAYDDRAVYLAIVAHEPGAATRQQVQTARDGAVWTDDCIDMFFDTARSRSKYRQFIISAANVQLDGASDGGVKWNATWQSAVKAHGDHWVYEVAIPHEALAGKAPAAGEVWGMNVCRNRRLLPDAARSETHSQWTLTYDTFQKPARFGDLRFE
jgi:hypothetical protein